MPGKTLSVKAVVSPQSGKQAHAYRDRAQEKARRKGRA